LRRFGCVNRAPSTQTRSELVSKAVEVLASCHGKPLREDDIQAMPDSIYDGETSNRLTSELKRGMLVFETKRAGLMPTSFLGREAGRECLSILFNGFEVLPPLV
jgi:hypothetical protein